MRVFQERAMASAREWEGHQQAVSDGRLFFDSKAEGPALGALDDAIAELRLAWAHLGDALDVKGLGSYPSGVALAAKFNLKAQEGMAVLEAHIATLEGMKSTIQVAAQAYRDAEAAGAAGFR